MKKVFLSVLVAVVLVCIPVTVLATDGSSASDFFTWDLLATYAGCLAATMLLTQFIKGVWPATWPTQILSYLIALVTLILANWAMGQLTWQSGALSIFNGAIVALAANGGFDNLKELIGKKEDSIGG